MDGPVYVIGEKVAYVRSSNDPAKRPSETRVFGPKASEHYSVGLMCQACQQPLKAGDYTVVFPLGPGDNAEQQEKARAGRPYRAVALELHVACVTGIVMS